MNTLKSWRALFVREYLEHRIAFFWFPLGIVALLALSGISALSLNRLKSIDGFVMPDALKVFELGYLVLLALWLAYLCIALFFYYGDAFAADRRNNTMFFWKSMPVSDLKILASKYFAGSAVFPAIIFGIAMVTGLMFYLLVNVGSYVLPGFALLSPIEALGSFIQVSLFGVVYFALALLWFAPFLAWVGGLSTVFGRWSLPLAFVIPGLLAVIENVALFGYGPRFGYIWNYLGYRFQFGFDDSDYTLMIFDSRPFNAGTFISRLVADIDWAQMGIGLVFATAIIWLASEYRRRRIA
jgi:ABC-2 type transport system permease protein